MRFECTINLVAIRTRFMGEFTPIYTESIRVPFNYYQLLLLLLLLLFFPHCHRLVLLTSLCILLALRVGGVRCPLWEVKPTTVSANFPYLHSDFAGWSDFSKSLIARRGLFTVWRLLHPLSNWRIMQSPALLSNPPQTDGWNKSNEPAKHRPLVRVCSLSCAQRSPC